MSDVVQIILVIAVLLVLASMIPPLADRLAIPHTTLLAALGMGLGLLVAGFGMLPAMGPFLDVAIGLYRVGLSADAFLYLFLPPLLFTAGLTIEVRLLMDEWPAVLLLAVVAVLVATLFVGGALNAVTDLGLVACLLLGAIVATTDPAAVISVFRDLGAPRRLTTLIAGESLLNDAAAIATFTLLLKLLAGTHQIDLAQAALTFLVDFAGGALFGFAVARVVCQMLPLLRNNPIAEITLSLGLAYLVYIVGEVYLKVSGVTAVVGAALTFAVSGRTRLRPDTWDSLLQTWGQLEYWASSLIFMLAAVLAARLVPEFQAADLGLLAIVVLAALAARALVLYGLVPGLSLLRLTEPIESRHKAVILWGGIRGAVTMVLALSVSRNAAVPPEVQHDIAILATGFVLFTLFVNAPSLSPLLSLLVLDRLSPTEQALRNRVMALSRAAIRDQLITVARDYGFDPALATRLAGEETQAARQAAETAEAGLPEQDRLRVALLTLAARERELTLVHFRQGTISRPMVARRVAAADRLIDRVKSHGLAGYEASAAADIAHGPAFRAALWLHRQFGWAAPLARAIAGRFEVLLVTQMAIRELRRFNKRAVRPMLGMVTSQTLSDVLAKRLTTVEDALTALELQYPAFAEALRAHYLARAGLRLEDSEYRRKLDEALISREVFRHLQGDLDQRRRDIERPPSLDLGLGLATMVQRVQAFETLDRDRLLEIARHLRPRLATPGERIVRHGARGTAMYFIASGSVEVALPQGTTTLGAGEFFGELALLTHEPRSADVTALTYCHLLVLHARDFRRLLRNDHALKARIEAVAERRRSENLEHDKT